jgi:DNA-binding HxlR family transcriptional regulator
MKATASAKSGMAAAASGSETGLVEWERGSFRSPEVRGPRSTYRRQEHVASIFVGEPWRERTNISGSETSIGAPVEAFVRVIRGRHKADIVIRLHHARLRFSELRRAIPGVSERVLARQLDELERDGVVSRTVYAEVPPRVEYELTSHGRTLCPIIKKMWQWGVEHGGGG